MTSTDPTASTTDHTASAGQHAVAPAQAPAAVVATTAEPTQPVLAQAPPRRSSSLLALGIVGIVLVSLIGLGVVVFLLYILGPDAVALGGIMALVPLAIVFFGVRWVDRWEPEPRVAVVFAFLWGAAVSVALALLIGTVVQIAQELSGGVDSFTADFLGSVVQAPLVEEGGKGLGLLILFWAARKHFDGPVDGLVYAAWVAGGFAFTENILYFGSALLDNGLFSGDTFFVFLVRGLMSPFAHVMFTAFIGVALGFAARRGAGPFAAIGYLLLGFIPAILLHGFWNGALYFVSDFFVYYFIVQVPLFIGAVLIAVWLRRQEAKVTRDRLGEYAGVGWFNPDEVVALATPAGRRQSMVWARQRGKGKEMKRYIQDATKLAFARQRIITGRYKAQAEADEALLLGSIVEARKALAGVGTPAAASTPAAAPTATPPAPTA
jgi:RsiW-degrading membrane proteinase PrsW (M82 family)